MQLKGFRVKRPYLFGLFCRAHGQRRQSGISGPWKCPSSSIGNLVRVRGGRGLGRSRLRAVDRLAFVATGRLHRLAEPEGNATLLGAAVSHDPGADGRGNRDFTIAGQRSGFPSYSCVSRGFR